MTSFGECSMVMQNFLMILLEICLILELILLMARITGLSGKKKIITAMTVFVVSFILMGFLMNDHRYCLGESAYQPMLRYPVSILIAVVIVLTLYLCWAIWREKRRYQHSLSYWSVNEAVDDVPCGVCFSDPLGRIVLCNTKMQELCRMMTGSYLQDYETLRKVMNDEPVSEGFFRLSSDSNVFYFPDASVWMFQEYHLLTGYTVLENILLAAELTCQDNAQNREWALSLLRRLNIEEKANEKTENLSGGQKQRVAIARALAGNPQVILADEPTGNLDVETGKSIVELLHNICESGSSVVMTTHNLQLLKDYPGRVYRCAEHQIVDVTDEYMPRQRTIEIDLNIDN